MEESRDLWELVIAGLAGGGAAAIIAAVIQASHARRERIRERMLTAADDFVTAAVQASMAFDGFVGLVSGQGYIAAWNEAQRRVHEATARMGRVELLFGEGEVSASGWEAVKKLTRALEQLDGSALGERAANVDVVGASSDISSFNKAARAAIAAPWWKRPVLGRRDRKVRRRAAKRRKAHVE